MFEDIEIMWNEIVWVKYCKKNKNKCKIFLCVKYDYYFINKKPQNKILIIILAVKNTITRARV